MRRIQSAAAPVLVAAVVALAIEGVASGLLTPVNNVVKNTQAKLQTAHVVAAANTYEPATVIVHEGGSLDFVNADPFTHNVVSRETTGTGAALFSTKVIKGPATTPVNGVSALAQGDYAFFCTIHEQMTGIFTVDAPSPLPPLV